MRKSIKVSEETYSRLEKELLPRETFDDVVRRLLDSYQTIKGRKVRKPRETSEKEAPTSTPTD
jgi:predicted CopG family antitoxin